MKNQNDMIKEVQALLEKGQIEEAIQLMESVPEAERGYELTGLLAREYANYGHSINHGESYLLKSLDLLESTSNHQLSQAGLTIGNERIAR